MPTTLDGGEAILEAFRNLGVEYIISSPGSEWAPVWEALARNRAGKPWSGRGISAVKPRRTKSGTIVGRAG